MHTHQFHDLFLFSWTLDKHHNTKKVKVIAAQGFYFEWGKKKKSTAKFYKTGAIYSPFFLLLFYKILMVGLKFWCRAETGSHAHWSEMRELWLGTAISVVLVHYQGETSYECHLLEKGLPGPVDDASQQLWAREQVSETAHHSNFFHQLCQQKQESMLILRVHSPYFQHFLQIQYYAREVQHLCFCAVGVDWVSNKKGKENATKCILLFVAGIWRYEQLLYSSPHTSVDTGLSSHWGETSEDSNLCTHCIRAGPGCSKFSIL